MSQEQIEEQEIKEVFQLTLSQDEGNKLFFLKNLSQRFGQANQNLSPSQQEGVICDICNKSWPSSQITFHRSICAVLAANQIQSTGPSQPATPPLISQATVTPTKLNRSLLSSALNERSAAFSSSELKLKYLVDCYQRVLIKETKTTITNVVELYLYFKEQIINYFREILIKDIINQTNYTNSNIIQNPITGIIDEVPSQFYDSLKAKLSEEEKKVVFGTLLTHLSFQFKQNTKGKNMLETDCVKILSKLHTLLQDQYVFQLFVNIMQEETNKGRQQMAREYEQTTIVSSYLQLSPIISNFDKNAFQYFKTIIPNYPNVNRQEVQFLQDNLRRFMKQPIDCIHSIFKKLFLNKEYKEIGINWISTILQLNDAKATLNLNDPLSFELSLMLSTDSYLLNLSYLLLEFCKPFIDPKNNKLTLVNNNYPLISNRIDISKYNKLSSKVTSSNKTIDIPENGFNFITEMYFMTFYGIHVGIIPAINQYNNFIQLYSQTKTQIDILKNKFGDNWKEQPNGDKLNNNYNRIIDLIDSYECQLLDTNLLDNLCKFATFSSQWMLSLVTPNVNQFTLQLFSSLPEFYIRDLVELYSLILRTRSDIIATMPFIISPLIEWCIVFLNNNTLVKSPIIRSKLCALLTELVYKKQNERTTGIFVPQIGNQFTIAFENSTIAQQNLVPGLLLLYCDVDRVEGLDVDKEKFDKYNVRRNISLLFNDLWELNSINKTIKMQANTTIFNQFIGTVVNDSIHLLQDSLARLVEVKQLQVAMSDVVDWNKQENEIKAERQRYFEIQEGAAKGFLTLALSILDLMAKLAKEKIFRKSFMESSMCKRVVAMLNHFYDSLCGPKCKNLKVQNPEKYNFSPKKLLGKITDITVQFTDENDFAEYMANDADYNPDIMNQALYFLNRENIVQHETYAQFDSFIKKVNSIYNATLMSTTETKSNTDAMDISSISYDELNNLYVDEMADKIFDTFEMKIEDPNKVRYNHHYNENIISGNTSNSSNKMTRLRKECQQLATSLPLSIGSSIFVRVDEERLDVMKAIITGPGDTPYSIGAFQFDIYFPPDYPLSACLVNLQTTGNGTVRFNPNLYNCGKVCLSLLGTWHGDNQTSKWNPSTSTVHQVLVSIQALILVEQPYFNEPAYEAQKGTKEGEERCFEYNENIRLATVRHAMIDQLKNPPKGFEDVIQSHFRIQKPRLLEQLDKWLKESSDLYRNKMTKAVEELKRELAKL